MALNTPKILASPDLSKFCDRFASVRSPSAGSRSRTAPLGGAPDPRREVGHLSGAAEVSSDFFKPVSSRNHPGLGPRATATPPTLLTTAARDADHLPPPQTPRRNSADAVKGLVCLRVENLRARDLDGLEAGFPGVLNARTRSSGAHSRANFIGLSGAKRR